MSLNQARKQSLLQMLIYEPNDVFLNYALAIEYIGENNFDEAQLQLQKVVSLNPNYLPSYYQLGQVKEKFNQFQDAIECYKKGIELAELQKNNKALGELKEALWMLEE